VIDCDCGVTFIAGVAVGMLWLAGAIKFGEWWVR
jgi:hypothetical protein